jgi:ABC-2 type transport system permease protein
MLVEIRLEIAKLVRKPRTYIGPAAMAVLIALVMIGLKYSRQFDHLHDRLEQDFIVVGTFINAAFLTRYLLDGVAYTFLPIFVCIVFGDLIASEAADGTLRAMLCRPITRLRVAASKYAVGLTYVLALTFGTGLLAYLVGSVFLGRGSLVVYSQGLWILPEKMAVLRLAAAYGLVAVGMLAVGSIAFAISTFLSNSNGAIAGAIGVLFGSAIIGELGYFASLKPYLLTTHLAAWPQFFIGSMDSVLFAKSAGVMLVYAVVSLIVGLIVFQRRDVLT